MVDPVPLHRSDKAPKDSYQPYVGTGAAFTAPKAFSQAEPTPEASHLHNPTGGYVRTFTSDNVDALASPRSSRTLAQAEPLPPAPPGEHHALQNPTGNALRAFSSDNVDAYAAPRALA